MLPDNHLVHNFQTLIIIIIIVIIINIINYCISKYNMMTVETQIQI